jgi:hypothetical protein
LLLLTVSPGAPARCADYHVSAAGDDASDGTTPERAWRTVARANRQELRPGNQVLFRARDAFDGNLVVKIAGTPSAATPVTIGVYGPGKATIRAGAGTGIFCENVGGIVVRDLIVEGKGRRANHGSGVSILNTLPGGKRLSYVRIENVEARGFGKYGIAIGGSPEDKSQSGFRDVRITRCRASDNAYAGIHTYGVHDYYAKTYAHRDIAIVDCAAHDNPGDPDYLDNHSGDGILLHDVDGGCIDGCTAFGNGGLCRAKSGGPVGIWAWSSRKLVIQHCVSVRNRTGGKYDGGGFDFDGGVSESVMQYNYSAENDGAGYLVFDFGAAPFRLADNVIRFNISENDGRKNGFAGISVNSAGDSVERLHIYHNTVFVGPPGGEELPSALLIHKSKDCRVHNNLFIAAGDCVLADQRHVHEPGLLRAQRRRRIEPARHARLAATVRARAQPAKRDEVVDRGVAVGPVDGQGRRGAIGVDLQRCRRGARWCDWCGDCGGARRARPARFDGIPLARHRVIIAPPGTIVPARPGPGRAILAR